MSIISKFPNSSLNIEAALMGWFSELRDTLNYNYALLQSQSADGNSDIQFKLGTFKNYKEYQIKIVNLTVSVGGILNVRLSDDNGATFKQGASDYQWGIDSEVFDGTPASSLTNDLADSEITLMEENAPLAAPKVLNGVVTIYNPSDTTSYTMVKWDLVYNDNSGNLVSAKGQGCYVAASLINCVQIYPSAGVISTGNITLIGMN